MSHKNNSDQLAAILEMGEKMGTRLSEMEAAFAKLGQATEAGLTPSQVFAQKQLQGPGYGPRLHKGIGWGQFLKDCYEACRNPSSENEAKMEKHGSKLVTKTALSGGTGATGGYTIPQQFADQLLMAAAEESFVAQMCTTLPMSARSILVPMLNQTSTPPTDGSAFYGGVSLTWSEETGTIGETEPAFTQLELVAHELTGYSEVGNSLIQDSAVSLDALLTTLLSKALGWAKDYYVLRGNGVAKPLGILNAPCTIGVTRTTTNKFKLADAANMLSRLLPNSRGTSAWVMSQTLIPELVQMVDAGNNVVWIPNFGLRDASQGGGAAQRIPMMLEGLPIFFTEKLPALGTKGDVMLCDFAQYLVGDRMELALDVSPHVKFRTNQMAWRAIARWDGQPWLKSYITLADGATTVSPFVALNT